MDVLIMCLFHVLMHTFSNTMFQIILTNPFIYFTGSLTVYFLVGRYYAAYKTTLLVVSSSVFLSFLVDLLLILR
jgi:hypothetical protein